MDLVLVFYSILFLSILAAPFVFLAFRYNPSESVFGQAPSDILLDLAEERKILLSNLADLKAEEETGKMKAGEFRELSREILGQLSELDGKIAQLPQSNDQIQTTPTAGLCDRTQAQLSSTDENVSHPFEVAFCRKCGTRTLPQAIYCHNCGSTLTQEMLT